MQATPTCWSQSSPQKRFLPPSGPSPGLRTGGDLGLPLRFPPAPRVRRRQARSVAAHHFNSQGNVGDKLFSLGLTRCQGHFLSPGWPDGGHGSLITKQEWSTRLLSCLYFQEKAGASQGGDRDRLPPHRTDVRECGHAHVHTYVLCDHTTTEDSEFAALEVQLSPRGPCLLYPEGLLWSSPTTQATVQGPEWGSREKACAEMGLRGLSSSAHPDPHPLRASLFPCLDLQLQATAPPPGPWVQEPPAIPCTSQFQALWFWIQGAFARSL